MGYSVLVVVIFLVRIWKIAVSAKKYCQKNFVELKSLLPLQPVSEKRLFRGAEKNRNEKGAQKKVWKKFAKQKKVSTFAARFAKTGTQSIDILKTSSKPTRFRKEER